MKKEEEIEEIYNDLYKLLKERLLKSHRNTMTLAGYCMSGNKGTQEFNDTLKETIDSMFDALEPVVCMKFMEEKFGVKPIKDNIRSTKSIESQRRTINTLSQIKTAVEANKE